jgi:hypothetical protein
LRPSQVVGGKIAGASDAHNMAAATFGTTATWAVWTWAIVWLLWSLAVLYVALRLHSARALGNVLPIAREDRAPRITIRARAARARWITAQVRSRRSSPRRSPARPWRRFRAPGSP